MYKRNNYMIGMAVLAGLALWFAYDGYFSEKFIEKHTLNQGTEEAQPDGTLVFNRKVWPFMLVGAAACGVGLLLIRGKKVTAGDSEVVIDGKRRIAYDRIEKIDKTHFEKKGYFVVTYADDQDKEVDVRLSDRTYDNLKAVLEEMIAKIT
jgi:hypothetical protein